MSPINEDNPSRPVHRRNSSKPYTSVQDGDSGDSEIVERLLLKIFDQVSGKMWNSQNVIANWDTSICLQVISMVLNPDQKAHAIEEEGEAREGEPLATNGGADAFDFVLLFSMMDEKVQEI